MIIYKTVISYSGTFDNEIDAIYWDKNVAIREAKQMIADDEKYHKIPSDYEIDWVDILTEVSNDRGKFTTIKIETIRHGQG